MPYRAVHIQMIQVVDIKLIVRNDECVWTQQSILVSRFQAKTKTGYTPTKSYAFLPKLKLWEKKVSFEPMQLRYGVYAYLFKFNHILSVKMILMRTTTTHNGTESQWTCTNRTTKWRVSFSKNRWNNTDQFCVVAIWHLTTCHSLEIKFLKKKLNLNDSGFWEMKDASQRERDRERAIKCKERWHSDENERKKQG